MTNAVKKYFLFLYAQPYAAKFAKRRLPADSYKNGIISDIRQVGGYREYRGTPYTDSYDDGMPDAYEIKYQLNPENAGDATLIAKSGYSNIEVYLNGIPPAATRKM